VSSCKEVKGDDVNVSLIYFLIVSLILMAVSFLSLLHMDGYSVIAVRTGNNITGLSGHNNQVKMFFAMVYNENQQIKRKLSL